ncbi:AAA family ATPase [Actinokineospora fastidiosa]|uniref:MoxR-like ATPase n=1 Tax=Actinokineospora fastidiosa TaxID=1816 RepID=A0A918LI38_9PSEU|nr:MoxR family ATPase [Actinokineospora fastidiosa]GGS54319.1 MoxR-like ATPase [Actinokineospora fastidiosa]
MTATLDQQATVFAQSFQRLLENVATAIVGKEHSIRLALTCLISGGHLLLEDNPGTGKTALAKAIAASMEGEHKRIQFTPDLLPSDVTGMRVYNPRTQQFEFHQGPVFGTVVLADEINRASPKTQSALLEAMEEGRVSIDGETHALGTPFMVIATQNPIEQAGTYRLPEAQLDRFLMRTMLGYPDHNAAMRLLAEAGTRDRSAAVQPVITRRGIAQLNQLADSVHVDPAILSYILRIAEASRVHPAVRLGVSVRGCLAYVRCVRTWAMSKGRSFVRPDDVMELALPVLGHRMLLDAQAKYVGTTEADVIQQLLQQTPPPQHGGAG